VTDHLAEGMPDLRQDYTIHIARHDLYVRNWGRP
jgi:hypothetical protein